MFNDERIGTRQNDPLHNTKRNTFFFFLPLMNHFKDKIRMQLRMKITNFFFSKPHNRYCQQKFLKTMHIFVTQTDVFPPIFKRLFNRPETLVQYILCRLDNIFVFLLSLPSRIIFISSSEALATLCSASATTDAICKQSNAKRR